MGSAVEFRLPDGRTQDHDDAIVGLGAAAASPVYAGPHEAREIPLATAT